MPGSGFELDIPKARAQIKRSQKRLYQHADGILLDQQETLRDRIISLAPERTGNLKRHVFVEVVQSVTGPVLKAGVRGLAYPVLVEFGTRFMAAQPFLRPAIAEMSGHISRRRKGRR